MILDSLLQDSLAIEAMDGALRYVPVGLALAIAGVAHFIYSLASRCWRNGVLIDYWHYVTGLGIVLPFFVMYPFSTATPNVISVGGNLDDIRGALGDAFLVNGAGYLMMIFGGWTARRNQKAMPRLQGGWYETVASRIVQSVLRSSLSIRFLELSCVFGILVLLFAQLQFGTVFGIRDRLFQEPSTRLIFNVWYSIYVVAFPLASLRLFHRPTMYLSFLLAVAFTCSAVTGSRTMTLMPALDILIAAMVVYRGRLRFGLIVGVVTVLAVVIGLVTTMRNAEQEEVAANVDFNVPLVTTLYGNSLSDLRDAAWVLSAWDTKGEYLLGRSYIAAAISFVPRGISDFRERYSIGTYTNELVNLDSTIHPGLRGGKFLEPHLNFGLLGVLVIGFFSGRFLGRTADFMMVQSADPRGLARAYAAIIPYFIFSQLLISAGFWVVYVLLFVILISEPRRAIQRVVRHASS